MESPEQIALDYLRPYREKWLVPLDIIRLPPTDYQGCHIEIRGETLLLTHAGETYTLSLKKLIVQIERQLSRIPERLVSTPRELARLLIRGAVENNEDITHLAYSHMGMGWYGYGASIGGYIHIPGAKPRYFDCWHIVVDEFEGEVVNQVFSLREIYQELM